MDNVALARYLKARNVKVETFNMINQDYAWGQDSKKDFTWSMEKLFPGAKPGEDLLPKFGAGQYGTEISALMAKPADVTHSSLWGGDLQAFVLQAAPRGLFQRTPGGARGRRPRAARPRRQDAQRRDPRRARRVRPDVAEVAAQRLVVGPLLARPTTSTRSQAPYRMVQSLLGLKLAVEKAMAANGGKKPTPRAARRGAEGLRVGFAGRPHPMALGDGHQAIQDTAIGKTRYDAAKKMVVLEDIQRFPAECVNPPAGHEVGGVDQGRLPRRQGLPVSAPRTACQ